MTAYSRRYSGQWSADRRCAAGVAADAAFASILRQRRPSTRRRSSDSVAAGALPADRTTLDGGLEWQRERERFGRGAPGLKAIELDGAGADARQHGRAGIVSAELAELPLLCQHPERVAYLRLQCAVEVMRARPPLETIPARYRRHRPSLQLLAEPVYRACNRHGHASLSCASTATLRSR